MIEGRRCEARGPRQALGLNAPAARGLYFVEACIRYPRGD